MFYREQRYRLGQALAVNASVRRGVLELRRPARCCWATLLQSVPSGVHAREAQETLRTQGGAVRWMPDHDPNPKNWARWESGRWRLERHVRSDILAFEPIAIVERADAAPLIGEPARYRAAVLRTTAMWGAGDTPLRPAPAMFDSLKEAQLWCEREVRLMEVGELA